MQQNPNGAEVASEYTRGLGKINALIGSGYRKCCRESAFLDGTPAYGMIFESPYLPSPSSRIIQIISREIPDSGSACEALVMAAYSSSSATRVMEGFLNLAITYPGAKSQTSIECPERFARFLLPGAANA